MGYRRSRASDEWNANHPPCKGGCGARVYWREGQYCPQCQALPERWCFECNRVSHTAGSVCLECDKPLGRLTFGFDRLSDTPPYGRKSENQRVGGWTDKTPHPDAVWHEIAPTAWRGGVQTVTPWPVFKAKAPGIGWPRENPVSGPSTAWYRKAIGEVNWYSCAVCGQKFGPGDGERYKTRKTTVVTGYNFDVSHDGPLAHASCPKTEYELNAEKASYLAQRARLNARNADLNAGRHTGDRWVGRNQLTWADPAQAPAPEPPPDPKGLLVNGEYFPAGYTREAAEYEQATRPKMLTNSAQSATL